MRQYRTFRVLVSAVLSGVAGKKKLAGIYRFLSEGYDWDIELIRTAEEMTPELLTSAASSGIDGFLAAIPETGEMHRLHASLGIPTVFTDFPNEKTIGEFHKCVFVMDDVRDICRSAANAFLSSGVCKSYLYADNAAGSRWSRERGDVFSAEMAKRGVNVVRIGPECITDQKKLAAVLLECEKPACVLSAYDDTAATVLSICRRAGLKIPEDVAVLGIGNDEDVCLHTVPPLSSVQPDFEEEGYRASRELQSMMLGAIPKKRLFFCGRSMVVDRSSTRNSTNSAVLSHDAMSFISRNALRGISAKDVAMHLHVSRRLADLRFREATGTSLQKAIIEKRLKEVCRLLSNSTLTISEIAVRCGYRDANYLKNLFKKRFGMSMRDWRKQNSQK